MSHFSTLVFTKTNGRSLEDLLAPYDEQIVCAPYVKYTREQAIKKVRKEIEEYKNGIYAEYLADTEKYIEKGCTEGHIKYLQEEFPLKLNWTDEECYQDMAQWYEEDMIDEEGNLLSTYNPNSKWDWYMVGGRWNNLLTKLNGERTNKGYVSEIDWKDTVPFSFVKPNGVWREKGKMGWFACVTNKKEDSEWKKEFLEFVNSLDDDVEVTVVDCHI